MKISLISIFIMAALFNSPGQNELTTVNQLDIERYLGTWYEIARLPNSFQKGLKCVTATYSIKKNRKIGVLNRGFSSKKMKYKEIKGTAWVPDPKFPGKLKVSFFWPFAGNYYIIELDEEYNYVLIGDPSREYLWILSRNVELDEEIYDKLMNIARGKGFVVSSVIRTEHNCK